MEPAATSIQVLLQAAEFLERRERGAAGARSPPGLAEAEHGYASLCPTRSRRAVGSVRRAQLRCCLERLKQQVPAGAGPARPTTLSLLHRARLHIQRLEEQELRARKAKDRLRNRQRNLQQRLEWLLSPTAGERARADSLDSSQLSEASEEEDVEIEVDGMAFSGDLLPSFGSGRDHSYSSPCIPAS
ncbi:max dimerization protein 3 isoform X2 [Pezoporus wallicus]|uniref:max dimerization protein 3 isoform X2 n=1 Tax=Pezoporus wallicus TaxID=35540 RepID=UPI00254E5856|nr:max dimerization protein 3 isoform X2 [Pezoporus wallicus]XP_061312726.1 max dimerization protein 3 isoform X2 [Pezoporus flaviventris]